MVLGTRFVVSLRIEKLVGVYLALGGRQRCSHGIELRSSLTCLEAQRHFGIDVAEDWSSMACISRHLVSPPQSITKVAMRCLWRIRKRFQHLESALGVVLLDVG